MHHRLLDTNALSELTKPDPDGSVLTWVARQRRADLCTIAISEAELGSGEQWNRYEALLLGGGRSQVMHSRTD
jgi:predicted nucleic acid-binding protein